LVKIGGLHPSRQAGTARQRIDKVLSRQAT